MTALLVGCEIVLYMADRLKAYMDFLQKLPATLARTNLETAMIKLYARILRFLARAIQIYETPSFRRALNAFWQDSDVQEFQKDSNKLGSDVEIEASNCDRTLSAQDRSRSERIKQDLQKALEEIKNIHSIQSSLN